MPPESQNQDAKLIQGEQKRLDLLDAKKDKKVEVGGKDFGKIIFEKTDELTKKINDDFGARDVRLINSKEFQALKKKGMNAIVTVLWSIDKKNIEVESRRLEVVITALEKSGESMRKLEAYLQNGDAMTDKMKDVDGNLEPLLKKIEEMRRKDDSETTFFGQKIHKGDMIELRPDGYNKPIKQILIVNIDTEGKTIRIQEVGSMIMQRRSYEDIASYVMALKGAYTRQFKGEEVHVAIRKRMVVEKTANGELLQQEELAKQYLQEKAILTWEQRILDKNAGVDFDEDMKNNPVCSSFFSTNQLQLKGGKLAFSVEFSKKNTDTVHGRRMEALKALELYLDKKPLVEKERKAISEKDEGAKYIAQAELALQEGRLADARRSAISYIHFQKQHPENFIRTPREEEKIQKINAYLEKIQELAIQKLRAANNATFGKSAYEAMKRRKVYSGDMRIYESAFSNVHARNAKILEQMTASKNETDLIRDPEEIFRTAQTAVDPMHTPELREAIKNCERIWNKVAYAETRFMTKNPKGEEKTAYADAAEALRTLGETSNAEGYLIAGMQDKIDIIKNADVGKKLKDTIILKLNAHREEYVKQVKSQFLSDHAWEEDAEIPEEIFNQLVDSAIERAADGELEKRIMKDIDFANDTGKLDTSADKRLAALHDRMLNPNDKFFAITDEEMYDTGDKVIGLAAEALVIGLSGGVGGIASAGTRALLMRIGARKLLAHAGAVVVEAGAFELANKTLAPHITGGPGFTTGQEFMKDWGRSILMFGALKGGGAYAQQLKKLHVDQLAKTGKVLSKTAEFGHSAFALTTEASAMTLSTEVQEIASGKSISEIDSLRLAADNLKMILELRLGGKLVAPITKPLHEYAKNIEEDTQRREGEKRNQTPESPGKSPSQLFDFAKQIGRMDVREAAKKFKEGFTDSMKSRDINDKRVAYSGAPFLADDIAAGLKNVVKPQTLPPTFRFMEGVDIFSNVLKDGKLDPKLLEIHEARSRQWGADIQSFEGYGDVLNAREGSAETVQLHSPENRASVLELMRFIREEINDNLTPGVDHIIARIEDSHITNAQKRTALDTVYVMYSKMNRMMAIANAIVHEARKRPLEDPEKDDRKNKIMADLLAAKMNLPTFKGKIIYRVVDGGIVIACENKDDFAAMTFSHPEHIPGGMKLGAKDTGIGIGIVVVRTLDAEHGGHATRHELQHIFNEGYNLNSPETIRSKKVISEQKDFIDVNGKVITENIEEWLDVTQGNNLLSFRDEALSYLREHIRGKSTVDRTMNALMAEDGFYDYWRNDTVIYGIENLGKADQALIKEKIDTKRTEYREKTKKWLEQIKMVVEKYQQEGMSEQDACDRLCDELLLVDVKDFDGFFKSILGSVAEEKWPNRLEEMKNESREKHNTPPSVPEFLQPERSLSEIRAGIQAVVENLRAAIELPSATVERVYKKYIESANIAPEHRQMALETIKNMLEAKEKTRTLLSDVHDRAIIELGISSENAGDEAVAELIKQKEREILSNILQEKMGRTIEGKIDFLMVNGILVIKVMKDSDIYKFANRPQNNTNLHVPGGLAMPKIRGLDIPGIIIRSDLDFDVEKNPTLRHEMQHIFNGGARKYESGLITENNKDAFYSVLKDRYLEPGDINQGEIAAWFKEYKKHAMAMFKDEALANLRTTGKSLARVFSGLTQSKLYNYMNEGVQNELLRVMTGGREDVMKGELTAVVSKIRENAQSEFIDEISEIGVNISNVVNLLQRNLRVDEIKARDILCDQLMFIPIPEWKTHLDDFFNEEKVKNSSSPSKGWGSV